jgi:hypothetical protein
LGSFVVSLARQVLVKWPEALLHLHLLQLPEMKETGLG